MEGGGVGLNRMSGIGSAQQSAGASEVMASSSANRTTKLDAGSAALQDVGSEAPVDQASLSTASGAVMQALLGSDVRGGQGSGIAADDRRRHVQRGSVRRGSQDNERVDGVGQRMKQRMADGGSERAGESDWRKLLVETRRALTRLRFEDLEELAGRAEEMLRSARAAKFSRPGALEFRARGGAAMARELRLLDELSACN